MHWQDSITGSTMAASAAGGAAWRRGPRGEEMLRELGVLAVTCVALGGPLAALAMLLNFRDRRQDRLLGLVARELDGMQGTVAFGVHCRAFWPSAVVRLDTWLCTPGEMWETSRRVIERLPPGVRLVSEGPLNGELVGALALVARRRIAPFRPRPADALGTSRAASAGDRLELRRAAVPAHRLGEPTRR